MSERKLLDLDTLRLGAGAHGDSEGYCLIEAVSVYCPVRHGLKAPAKKTDHPKDVSPVLAAFGRAWNDGMRSDKEREQLKQYVPLLCKTAASPEIEEQRAWLATDWLLRVHLPAWLDLTPSLALHAKSLRECEEIASLAGLTAAQAPLAAARAAARAAAWDAAWAAAGAAAWDAAWAAAGAAAWDAALAAARAAARAAAWAAARAAARAAAWDAARDAAGAAAWDAARDAAGAAAWDAARAAAGAAAWDALEPTVTSLQASAHDLYHRMIACGSPAPEDAP